MATIKTQIKKESNGDVVYPETSADQIKMVNTSLGETAEEAINRATTKPTAVETVWFDDNAQVQYLVYCTSGSILFIYGQLNYSGPDGGSTLLLAMPLSITRRLISPQYCIVGARSTSPLFWGNVERVDDTRIRIDTTEGLNGGNTVNFNMAVMLDFDPDA